MVVSQVTGEFKVKDQRMMSYLKEVEIMEFEVKDQRMMSYLREVEIMKCQFKKIEISHIT